MIDTDTMDASLERAAYALHQAADDIIERLTSTGTPDDLSEDEEELLRKAREYRARMEQPL
jgi:hypothetical protein